MTKPVRLNDALDLDRLHFPAAYVMRKITEDSDATSTTMAYVIKATESVYLVSCTAYRQEDVGLNGPTNGFQVLDTRTPVQMRDKFSGFDFIPADIYFSENSEKPEVHM